MKVEEAVIRTKSPSHYTTTSTTTTQSSKHGCSHQRQPCISEEMLRTLQQLASGLSAGARTYSDSGGGYPPVEPEEPGQAAQHSLQCHHYRTDIAGQTHSFLLAQQFQWSCWCAAYTSRSPSSIKNVCILNNLLHK